MKFYMKIAGLTVEAECQYDFLKEHCRDYCVSEGDADVYFSISQDEIEDERGDDNTHTFAKEYLETVAALRKLGELLPERNCVLCHGAVITYGAYGAFLFTGPSGIGKSTHIKLWQKYFGEKVDIINGDKPVLGVRDGYVQAYGTPWAGKEGWQKNIEAPLKGICFLRQGAENTIRKVTPLECLDKMFSQIYMPRDKGAMDHTLRLMERILEYVPVYVLTCNISEEAVKTSFEMMTRLVYEEEKNDHEN